MSVEKQDFSTLVLEKEKIESEIKELENVLKSVIH